MRFSGDVPPPVVAFSEPIVWCAHLDAAASIEAIGPLHDQGAFAEGAWGGSEISFEVGLGCIFASDGGAAVRRLEDRNDLDWLDQASLVARVGLVMVPPVDADVAEQVARRALLGPSTGPIEAPVAKAGRRVVHLVRSATGGPRRAGPGSGVEAGGVMSNSEAIGRLVEAFDQLDGWPDALVTPTGYPDSLALCVLDAIWSVNTRYSAVVNVLNNYRSWLHDHERGSADDRSARQLLDDINFAGGAEGFASVVRNRGRTSTRGGVLKAQAVRDAAEALVDHGVNTTAELRSYQPSGEEAWRAVTGQRSGVTWHYLSVLAGEQDIKPDRMIVRFVERALGQPTASHSAYALLHAAHQHLDEAHRPDLRTLDNAIWASIRRRRSPAG